MLVPLKEVRCAVGRWLDDKPLVGVVGLPALPGSPAHRGESLQEVAERAADDAMAYAAAGFDAIMLQNVGDRPATAAAGPETVAWMTAVGLQVRAACALPCGVSVLKNDARAAIAIAQVLQAEFVRVKVWVGAMVGPEGILEGVAADALRYRAAIGAQTVAIWADVHDRTGVPLGQDSLEHCAIEAVNFGMADAIIVTGRSERETLEWLSRAKDAVGSTRVLVGGGVTPANVDAMLVHADGVVVATAVKYAADLLNPVDHEAARQMATAVTRARDRARRA